MTTALALNSRSALKAVTRTLVSRSVGPVATTSMRYSSTMHDNDPDVLDTEKKRNLSKTQHGTSTPHDHAPGWNEHLASASEAHADRSTASPNELTDKTIKDAVDGPLGQAEGHDGQLIEETVEKKKSTTKKCIAT
ncbi:ctg1 protein [Lentinula edodes]|uniref:Ctg1 protein n=1 Tax=Lentinula edodes TaxID=5353 RepID=A0A1Q3E5P3_LENED|nr:ctg1 protein [Lentinula edodes]